MTRSLVLFGCLSLLLTIPAAARERALAIRERADAFVCRPAAVHVFRGRHAEAASLRVMSEGETVLRSGGLNIILRATEQLEQFPEAKATFVRAQRHDGSRGSRIRSRSTSTSTSGPRSSASRSAQASSVSRFPTTG